jgi:hypothetical protein
MQPTITQGRQEHLVLLRVAAFAALVFGLAAVAPVSAQTSSTSQSSSFQSSTTQSGGIRITFDGSYAGVVGQPVTFSAQVDTSGVPPGTAVQIEWNFGDGGTATGQTVTHTYSAPGTYTVTLTVTAPGQRSTLSTTATISGAQQSGSSMSGAQQQGAAATTRVDLTAGCTNLVLTWPDGTPIGAVVAALSSNGLLNAIWWLDAATRQFRGFSPAPGAPNDLTTVNRLQTVFICLTAPGTLTRPAR